MMTSPTNCDRTLEICVKTEYILHHIFSVYIYIYILLLHSLKKAYSYVVIVFMFREYVYNGKYLVYSASW